MADAAEYVVALIDKVTGPARKAAASVEKLERQIKKTGSIRPSFEGPFSPEAYRKSMRENLATFAKTRFVAPAVRGLDAGFNTVTDKALTAAKYGVAALGAAGIAAGTALVKGTMHAALFAESSMMAFQTLTGSSEQANVAWQKSIALSKQLGQGLEETANSMKHLLAMQFSLGEAEELVKISADLQAVTGDAQSVERALRAITQIKAKGKVQAEELVGQLAEAGVSTVLVYEELEKITGKSRAQVMKSISAGQIDADTGIKAIKAAILRKTHSTEAGQAGTNVAQSTFGGLVAQLKNAPALLFTRLAEQVKANIDKFRPAVQKVIDAIDRIQGDQMAKFVGNVLTFAERLVPLALEFAAGFGDGFASINEAMGAIDPAKASMQTARDLGKALAEAFGLALQALKKIAELVVWLDQHREIAMFAASTLVGLKILGGIAGTIGAVKAVAGLFGAGTAVAGAAGATGAATTAAAATAATSASTAGAVTVGAAGTSGGAALLAGVGGAAGVAAIGAAGAGLGLATASYIYREELANWLLGLTGRSDQTQVRGLGQGTPTPMLAGLQRAAGPRNTNNNVTMQTTVNVDGTGKDGADIGKEIAAGQQDSMAQWVRNQALEQGAM